jgi:hypothetical protein
VIYQLDTYFTGGTALVTQPYQVFLPFLSLWDDFIYISARTGASVYNVPILNGYYTVELRFAEIEDKKLGERVFSVKVQVRREQCLRERREEEERDALGGGNDEARIDAFSSVRMEQL